MTGPELPAESDEGKAQELAECQMDGYLKEVGSRLDRLSPGPIHYWILSLISFVIFIDFFDLTMGGAIAGSLQKSGWSTLALNSLFFSAAGLGAAIGVLVSGIVADRYGRLISLQLSLAALTLGTLACAAAISMEQLIAARVAAAIGMGGIPTVGYVYLSEILPARVRGSWISGGGVIIASSTTFAALAAYYLLPLGLWREMFVLPAAVAIVLFFILRRLPESPRWLAASGRFEAAEVSLAKIVAGAGRRVGNNDGVAAVACSGFEHSAARTSGEVDTPLQRFILAALLAIAATAVSNSYITWLPTVLMSDGTIAYGLGDNFLINLGAPLGTACGIIVADRIGRKNGIGLVAFTGFALAIVAAIVGRDSGLVVTAFLLMAIINLVCTLILGIYLPELFPSRARARGTSFALTVARISLILAPFVVAFLLQLAGRVGLMMFISGCFLLIAVVTTLFGVETAKRPLFEES